nr:GGDEF domain-containing protein [Thiorhodococcus mannitoliphagus]
MKQELHRLLFDPLTGLVNRHELELALPRHLAATHRNRAQLSVIAIDLDHFRDVNNCFGHAFGDAALHHFASILKAQCRAMDLAVRQGGEEFLVLLPNTTTDSAVQIAERIRLALESKPLPLTADATTRLRETSNADCRHQLTDDTLRLTASLGVATERGADQDIPLETLAEELLKRADRALYRAKESGRNCVCR